MGNYDNAELTPGLRRLVPERCDKGTGQVNLRPAARDLGRGPAARDLGRGNLDKRTGSFARGDIGKAAQPRSSEKNAASRAGQTPCKRWAVGFCLLKLESPKRLRIVPGPVYQQAADARSSGCIGVGGDAQVRSRAPGCTGVGIGVGGDARGFVRRCRRGGGRRRG